MRFLSRSLATLGGIAAWLHGVEALAAPEARILGIDATAGIAAGRPLLRTLVEVGEATSVAEVVANAGCGALRADQQLDCIASALKDEHALWRPLPFSQSAARLTARIDIRDVPLTFDSKESFNGPTAWLVALDASSTMGTTYADAREAANEVAFAVGTKDFVRVVVFDDRTTPLVADSRWLPAAEKEKVKDLLLRIPSPSPSHQAARPFVEQVRSMLASFADLRTLPLHRVMVVLSNGATNHANVASKLVSQRATNGRFPEDDAHAAKVPVAMVPVFFSPKVYSADPSAARGLQIMEGFANPEVGGRFAVIRPGQGVGGANAVLGALWTRTATRSLVTWRMPCISSTPTQTFSLFFPEAMPPIAGDRTFEDVPIGIDPAKWPLDVQGSSLERGRFRATGEFCWGTDKARVEVQFVGKDRAESVRVAADAVTDSEIEVPFPSAPNLVDEGRVRFKLVDLTTKRESPVIRTRVASAGGGARASAPRPVVVDAAPPAKAGCGCHVPGRRPTSSALAWLVVASAVAAGALRTRKRT